MSGRGWLSVPRKWDSGILLIIIVCSTRVCCHLGKTAFTRRSMMNDMLLRFSIRIQDLATREEAQDLVEYALVVALIAFGATAGMKNLASAINTAFSNVSSRLGTSIS
jgi:pilus assembly protein Flp/PilA